MNKIASLLSPYQFVRQTAVVVPALCKSWNPAFVELLLAELAFEALDVAALHRAFSLDQDVADAIPPAPGYECPCSSLNLLFFMSVVLLGGDGRLHQLQLDMAGGKQVRRHFFQSAHPVF